MNRSSTAKHKKVLGEKSLSVSVQNNAAGSRSQSTHSLSFLSLAALMLIDLCERVHVLDIMEEFLSNRTSCFFAGRSGHPFIIHQQTRHSQSMRVCSLLREMLSVAFEEMIARAHTTNRVIQHLQRSCGADDFPANTRKITLLIVCSFLEFMSNYIYNSSLFGCTWITSLYVSVFFRSLANIQLNIKLKKIT